MAQNIRVLHPYSDTRLQKPQFSMTQQFEIVQYYLQDLRTENQSFLTQVKSAKFSVEISEGQFKGLDNNKIFEIFIIFFVYLFEIIYFI